MTENETEWRLLEIQPYSAFLNMALDESICEHIVSGQSPPTIRFYQWLPSAVSIGYFQSLEQEVHQDQCRAWGIDIVRRRTGGGAVYHDSNGEITYSVLAPVSLFPSGITQSYWKICGWIVNGLAAAGIASEFKPINDVITDGKKISGNAQTRRNGILQQHGTILYDLDVETMFSVLKVGKEKISDKFIASVKERVTSAKEQANVSQTQLYHALKKGFCEDKKIIATPLLESELKRAEQLAEEKYASNEWLNLR